MDILKRKGYTDLYIRHIKTTKRLVITRRNNNKICQKLGLDKKEVDWVIKLFTVDKNAEKYEPLQTEDGLLEAALSHKELLVDPFIVIFNEKKQEKVILAIKEIGWVLEQLKKERK